MFWTEVSVVALRLGLVGSGRLALILPLGRSGRCCGRSPGCVYDARDVPVVWRTDS